jgi:hypothetical protein
MDPMTAKRTRYSVESTAKVTLAAPSGELTTVQLTAKRRIHHMMWGNESAKP